MRRLFLQPIDHRHVTHGTATRPRERFCTECGWRIPVERLRLLPDTWTCVRHSGERPLTEADALVEALETPGGLL